jgi:hypothetical protein
VARHSARPKALMCLRPAELRSDTHDLLTDLKSVVSTVRGIGLHDEPLSLAPSESGGSVIVLAV